MRKSAARRTAPSVSGATSSRARRSAKSPAATTGFVTRSGARRATTSTPDGPGDEHAEHGRRPSVVGEADHRDGRERHDGQREARDREHHDRARGLDRDPAHQATSRCPAARRPQPQRRGGSAGGVDRPVERVAVAALDEGLVVLVGGGVPAGEQEREQGGAAGARHGRKRAPPQEAQQRVLGEVDQLAADQVDRPEAGVEAGLVGKEEDRAHQEQRREPQVESQRAHAHTVESVAVLVITSKSPYAVRALSELARRGDSAPVPIGDLARAREIPVQFLEGLFATLRRAGVLQSQRGVKGGYSFARPPSEVTLLEIVELLEGELGAEAAASGPIWTEAADAVRAVLAGTTIADVAEREARDSAAPMYYI